MCQLCGIAVVKLFIIVSVPFHTTERGAFAITHIAQSLCFRRDCYKWTACEWTRSFWFVPFLWHWARVVDRFQIIIPSCDRAKLKMRNFWYSRDIPSEHLYKRRVCTQMHMQMHHAAFEWSFHKYLLRIARCNCTILWMWVCVFGNVIDYIIGRSWRSMPD